MKKFETNVARVFGEKQRRQVLAVCTNRAKLEAMPVHEFVDLLASS